MSPFSSLTNKTALSGFLYGGKEREHAGGRNSYDFSARCLISPLGQWGAPDSKAEKTPWQSIYSYCGGDPINYIDPDKKETVCVSRDKVRNLQLLMIYSTRHISEELQLTLS